MVSKAAEVLFFIDILNIITTLGSLINTQELRCHHTILYFECNVGIIGISIDFRKEQCIYSVNTSIQILLKNYFGGKHETIFCSASNKA